MSADEQLEVLRYPVSDEAELVRVVHDVIVGTTSRRVTAEAIVPNGRIVRARVYEMTSYAEPYVQVGLVDERNRELGKTRVYTGSDQMLDARHKAIESAALALATLTENGETVDVQVGGKTVRVAATVLDTEPA